MQKRSWKKALLSVLLVIGMLALAACGGNNAGNQSGSGSSGGSGTSGSASGGGGDAVKPDVIKVALSAFQDVNSIHVGIEKGFFAEENIEVQIQNTDWPGANELLVGGHVDLATSSDSDVILQNTSGQETTFAFPIFYFAGGGLMYDPNKHADWKTYDELLPGHGNDVLATMKTVLEQTKGAKVGVSAGGGEYATFIEMLSVSGLNAEDFVIVDLAQEELPPALLSGSIDIMISGIPQRLAVQQQGYATLIDQTALPSTISHAGFAASRSWIDANLDLASRIQKVFFKTLDYIEKNPDETFPIISAKLKEAGTVVSVEDLKGVWNKMEFFPNSKAWYEKEVVAEDGRFYWKDRFETVLENLRVEGKVPSDVEFDLEQLNYALKIIDNIKE